MEKLFWGMVGGCTVAFAILLGMYLNKTGVIGAEPETSTEIVSEIETETETEGEMLAEGELPSDIQSFIEDSQDNYAPAMKVFEDESSAAASREAAEVQRTTTGTSGSDPKTNGSVDGNRNGSHDYFLEDPAEEESESESEESSTEAAKPEEKKTSEYEYTLYQDHVVLKKYVGSAATLDVPDTIDGQPVTEISDSAFASSKTLVRVSLPDTVEKLGKNVFKSSELLVDVTLPDRLTEMGEGVFDSCTKLARITIPDGVTRIGKKAFNECTNLKTVKLSNDIETIEEQAFNNCGRMEMTKLPSPLS